MSERGLGKGLGALLGDAALQDQEGGSVTLKIAEIEPNSLQPRKAFDDDALFELSESIRLHGIIQPLTVRRLSSGYYQLIAGERRWRAARLAGLKEVPALIIEADDRKAMELALIENLQREDLNPIEEAEGFKTLIDQHGLTQDEVSSQIGRSRPAITNSMRLLLLPEPVKELVSGGKLSSGHARTLLAIKSDEKILSLAEKIINEALSVRQTEALVKRESDNDGASEKETKKPLNFLEDTEKRLSMRLGRKVRIVAGQKKGRFEIDFYGNDDLENLIAILDGIPSVPMGVISGNGSTGQA